MASLIIRCNLSTSESTAHKEANINCCCWLQLRQGCNRHFYCRFRRFSIQLASVLFLLTLLEKTPLSSSQLPTEILVEDEPFSWMVRPCHPKICLVAKILERAELLVLVLLLNFLFHVPEIGVVLLSYLLFLVRLFFLLVHTVIYIGVIY